MLRRQEINYGGLTT